MPIYAYRCEHCGFQQDILRKLSDPPLATCPSCGQDTFRKQITAAGFQLKGSGWYVTDFRNPPAKDGAKTESKGDGEAKSDAKADAKADAKPDAKPSGDKAPVASPPAAAPSDGGTSPKPAASPPSST